MNRQHNADTAPRDDKGWRIKMTCAEKAVRVLDEGNILCGDDYFYLHSAVRKMMGIDSSHQAKTVLIFDRHRFYKTQDGRVIDEDDKTQSARIISQEQFDSICARRAERVKAEMRDLLSTNYLDLTCATVNPKEIIAALGVNPNPVRVEGGEGSGSYCGWRQSEYMLPDGRTLSIGNGPDEGWTTAWIR